MAASRTGHLLPLRPAPLAEAPAGISHASGGKLLVHLFYSSSCPDCAIFRDKILPDLETTYADHVIFLEHDTQTEEGVKLLFTYLDKTGQGHAGQPGGHAEDVHGQPLLLGTDEAATRAMVEIAAALAASQEKKEN
ncbi:hypothetical protein HS125_18400 [bacterium]|nr:hypothetical protein [bacterium]